VSTRLYTLLGRAGGYDGILSVGRVQTPLLGLVVRRDLEIDRFRPRTYYLIRAAVRCAAGGFTAVWQPPDDVAGVLDEAGRLVARDYALAVQTRLAGKPGTIVRCSREKKTEAAPLLYSLPDVQIDAGKRLGLSPKQTLDACQALYETHRLLTYPRSDCSYLPEGQHGQASAVLAMVAANVPALVGAIRKADTSRRSRVWNDKKVTAHHAIIPTLVAKPSSELSAAERGIYELVARRYLAQFYPPFEFHETKIKIDVSGERLRASGRQTLSDGWRAVFATPQDATSTEQDPGAETEGESSQSLPLLREGETVMCGDVAVAEKQTTPPKRFTDATLIQAMTGIARFVDDPKVKQLLRETDGIGTPATQAQIIETLFERRFIETQGRHVISTEIGRALIRTLPEIATRPDITALWEAAMRRIADGQMSLAAFLDAVMVQLRELVTTGRALRELHVPNDRDGTRAPQGARRGGRPPRHPRRTPRS
jgi:DNA topoisomerase-3